MAGGGEQQNKRPPMPGVESSSKKTTMAPSASPTCPASGPSVIVKQEPEWGAGFHGGGASRASARAAAAAELPRINGSLELSLLHCAIAGCHRPLNLKTPVFKCEAGHRLCSGCHDGAGEGHCRKCNRATAFVPCGTDLDAFVGGFMVPCPFEAYGCGSSVVYHDAAAHRDACAYAPCPCALCPFTASPRMLRDHLAADHAWRVHALPSYGKPLQLRVPASDAHRLLVVDGDERRLFVLSVRGLGAYWAVSVACVRASAEAGPRYACLLWAQAPGIPAGKSRFLQMQTDVASCAVPGGAAVEEGTGMAVPPTMVLDPSKEIRLSVRIDLADPAPPTSTC